MNEDKKGSRSYKGEVFGDSMAITINFKWLLQIIAGTAIVVYAFWKIEGRIQALERDMVLALEEIKIHEQERKLAEEKHVKDIQDQLLWYESELNLNPLSWGKKNRKK